MGMGKTMDELTALVERYPGVVNTPTIILILIFAAFVFYFVCRPTLSFPPGRFGRVLAICLKSGSYLMVSCCLWGCVLLGSQKSLAKQQHPINPVLAAAVVMAWGLIVVPYSLSKPSRKKNDRDKIN
jgi:UDP-N-acetylmuramyl pentapeptide phosphotransferase/UDP-N-acetylglucosamine-1-phosphate transferase